MAYESAATDPIRIARVAAEYVTTTVAAAGLGLILAILGASRPQK